MDLFQLDSIEDFDTTVAALDGFMDELMVEFMETPECGTYLESYPEMEEYLGNWIYHLLYYGYVDRSVTLPQMTKTEVEAIVTEIFPRKVVLTELAQANYTIPELSAFWQYLDRVYQHPHAPKVLGLFKGLETSFVQLMNDPSKFGVGKSFMAKGLAAGFDMTSEAGVLAYQQSTNLPDLDLLIDSIGSEEITGLENLVNGLISKSSANNDNYSELSADAIVELLRGAASAQTGDDEIEELVDLSTEQVELLTKQSIDLTSPGTILADFQIFLDFIGNEGISVSEKIHTLSAKSLADLNQRLSQPIELDLKRPIQQSYPAIDGLYLLLRACGLGEVRLIDKKYILSLNLTLLKIWDGLNQTERYFMLLEIWLIRADGDLFGDDRLSLDNQGMKCIEYWQIAIDQTKTFDDYDDQDILHYSPELYNLALLEMFGFIRIAAGRADENRGWRIDRVEKLPFGDAMMLVIYQAFLATGMYWASEEDPDLPFGELQPIFQPYFPEWKCTL